MSDGIQIQTVVSDNSVYYHQRQHRSLEHDSIGGGGGSGMYSSSDRSTSLNSSNEQQQLIQQLQQQQQQGPFQSSHHAHFHHHHHYQQAAAALHQLRAVQDCENMNISVPTTATAVATSSGKLYANLNNNNNSSNNNKNIGRKMNWCQQQKLEKIKNASNNNNNGGGSGEEAGSAGKATSSAVNGTNGTASKSIISRLRQLTGRLSFNFDSKESKKLQQTVAVDVVDVRESPQIDGSGKGGSASCLQKKARLLEKSKTVDVGGSVAICGGGEGMGEYCCATGVILNQPKSISPILMQQRNSDIINSINTARNRAYSLDVPIGRNCCRSLSGSTAGGGGSSCGGSHKSLTFSLNKSLNEEANDTTLSSGGGLRQPPIDDTTKSGGSISETI